jgi:PAS domain S-box-containing protein
MPHPNAVAPGRRFPPTGDGENPAALTLSETVQRYRASRRFQMIDETDSIAARKLDQEQLLMSESRYRRLFETARDGIVILDAVNRKITDVNPFMLELLGYSRDELIGRELWEIGLLKDMAASQGAFRELQEQGYLRYPELLLQTKEGKRREVEFVSNVYAENGHQVIQCNIREITERKQAEGALREAHHRLSFHVGNTPLAVIEWDSDFRLSRWSPSAEAIFGWKAEEVLGKRVSDWRFVFSDDIDAVADVMTRQRQSIEQCSVSRNRNYAKDGSVLHCEWYNSVLYDESGKLESVLSLVLDITERKRAEAERDRLLVREQEARKEAEQANRSKDEFLATISHELRTPLTSILGWARLLASGEVDTNQHAQAFETIARNAKSQAQLIDDLLDVSRIISGKLRLDLRPLELAPVIEAAVDSVRPAAKAKEIRLQLMLDPHIGQVSADPDRLQQLIWNLLSNAIKFTPRGGQVQVRLESDNSCAEITVSDTGQGIRAEFLPHVFDRFRQEDGSSTRTHGGLGLGLAIVRRLVELHGGTVQVESEGEGLGAVFKMKLPFIGVTDSQRTLAGDAAERRLSKGYSKLLEQSPRLDGLRVLIVDDEADAREFVTLILDRHGADAIAVASTSEAWEMLERWRPDVLIADIGMPDEDGYALIRKVRSLPSEEGGRTPAIALTAYARTEDRMRILLAGYQMHLAKPVEPIELIVAVASLTGRRSTS